MRDEALTYAQSHQSEALEDLKTFLRIPSVSTLPEHQPDMQRAAQWLADKFTTLGLQHIAIMPTAGHPVVYADWLHAGVQAPTLLIYGHYDVQPADPLEEWSTPPFEPTVRDDKLYARGADDNKGQHYSHLAAVEAYLKTSGRLPLNVKFLIEGEEEIGSPNLRAFIKEQHELLKADVAVISDTGMIDANTPAIVTGLRGLVYMEITLRGSAQDLHSGAYGGVVENPLNAMAKMLAALHDDNGRVTIPHFYDQVEVLDPAERERLSHSPLTAELVQQETGAPALWGEMGYHVAERIGTRPTLDVHGIRGGFIGEGQKTVIPAVAMAKVSMRLVPHQDSTEIAELFRQHIEAICPKTMILTVRKLSAENGAVVDGNHPSIEAAAQAYQLAFGQRPVLLREGGSLPVVTMFMEILQAPVVLMGFGLPDDHIHSPNERYHLPNLYRGIETAIHYYDILGKQEK